MLSLARIEPEGHADRRGRQPAVVGITTTAATTFVLCPRPTREASDKDPAAVADGRWQVFGLVDDTGGFARGAYWPSLPRHLAQCV